MYKVIDEITGEMFSFEDRYDAEVEAERRLNIHLSGYSVRRTYVSPVNAVLKKEGMVYTICLG